MAIEFRKEKPAFINFCQVIIYKGNVFFFITENWAKRTYIHTHKKKQNMSLASFLLRQPVGFCEQIGRTFCPFHPSLLSLSRSPSPFQLSLSVALLLSRSPCHHEKKHRKYLPKLLCLRFVC